jgi:hypothetical protein
MEFEVIFPVSLNELTPGRTRRKRVKGCPRDYVGSTSGVPQIADDLLHCFNSAALGQKRSFLRRSNFQRPAYSITSSVSVADRRNRTDSPNSYSAEQSLSLWPGLQCKP